MQCAVSIDARARVSLSLTDLYPSTTRVVRAQSDPGSQCPRNTAPPRSPPV